MTSRLLPPADWPRLVGTEAEAIWPLLDPATAQVLVVEAADQIVGCWILAPVLHAECLWIAPAHRKTGSVGRRLWMAMQRAVLATGSHSVATAAISDEVKGLLEKVGATKLPGEHFVMHIHPRTPSCPPS